MPYQRFMHLIGVATLLSMVCEPAAAAQTAPPPEFSDKVLQIDNRSSILPGGLSMSNDPPASSRWAAASNVAPDFSKQMRIPVTRQVKSSSTKSAALKWELAYLALSAVDAAQTISCLNRGICEEANPIFGKNPKTSTLIAAKVVGSLVHFTAFHLLNERNPKAALRVAQLSAGLQGGVVMLNSRFSF